MFHIQATEYTTWCGLSLRGRASFSNAFFPMGRVTDKALVDPQTCRTCVDGYQRLVAGSVRVSRRMGIKVLLYDGLA